MNDPQFTLSPLNKEEGEKIVAKLQAFLAENEVDLVVTPLITKEGTIGAKVEVFKKVELVPKEGSVLSPIQDVNGEKAD